MRRTFTPARGLKRDHGVTALDEIRKIDDDSCEALGRAHVVGPHLCAAAAERFESFGGHVEVVSPSWEDPEEIFRTMVGAETWGAWGERLEADAAAAARPRAIPRRRVVDRAEDHQPRDASVGVARACHLRRVERLLEQYLKLLFHPDLRRFDERIADDEDAHAGTVDHRAGRAGASARSAR